MKLAIMQPYFFPYIGYFQLMSAVDVFVLYDNVQFIKDGWVNRNRILVNKQERMITLPLQKDSYTTRINERSLSLSRWTHEKRKLIMKIQQNYGKAPFFAQVFPLVEGCICYNEMNLFKFIQNSLARVCEYLDISTKTLTSSQLDVSHELSGQDRVIEICRVLGADQYINAIGGSKLYDRDAFKKHGIQLCFIRSKDIVYPQFNGEFISWLSIIDVLMFNPADKIKGYLSHYELV